MTAVGRREEASAVLDRAVSVATRLGMPGATTFASLPKD
jgi:hypothetical protein